MTDAFAERPVLRATRPGQEKIAASTESAAFICLGETCSLPVREPQAIADAVAAMRGEHQTGAGASRSLRDGTS